LKKILITGGAGFIGTQLCHELKSSNYHITVIDSLVPQVHGLKSGSTIEIFKKKFPNFHFIHADVNDTNCLVEALDGVDIIVHLASETGTAQSMYELKKYYTSNVVGTASLCEAITRSDTKPQRVILSSSRAVYGEGMYICEKDGEIFPESRLTRSLINKEFDCTCPKCGNIVVVTATPETAQLHPSSQYGISKYTQECILELTSKTCDFDLVILRLQNVYGPGQSLSNPYTGVLAAFYNSFLFDKEIEVYEDGKSVRDFIYISDVINVFKRIICLESINSNIYNVGSGVGLRMEETVILMQKILNKSVKYRISSKARAGDIRSNFADISKIVNDINFSPLVTFEIGFPLFFGWAKEQLVTDNKLSDSLLELKRNKLLYD